jgi:hypothetical protein
MADMTDFVDAAGWEADENLWLFEGDHQEGLAENQVRFMAAHRGRALAVEVGLNEFGPFLQIRAFDGDEPARCVGISLLGDLTITVGERKEPE